MTDQPTRRIGTPHSAGSATEAVPTQRGYSRYPEREGRAAALSPGGESERATQANALAWSDGEQLLRPEGRQYYSDAYVAHQRPLPDQLAGANEYSNQAAHGAPWYRQP